MMSDNKSQDTAKPEENNTPNSNTQSTSAEQKPENNPQAPPAAPAAASTAQPQSPAVSAPTVKPVHSDTNDQKPKPGSNMKMLLLSLVMFLIGIGGGILLFMTYPKAQEKAMPVTPSATPTPAPLTLPADAQKIEECVDGEGEAYISRSSPDRNMRYLGFKNKLIGFQYKLSGDMLNFNTLKLPKADIDHASVRIAKNISPLMLRPVEIGNPEPTTELMTMEARVPAAESNQDIYVNFYLVDSKTSAGIQCEPRMIPMQVSSPSANAAGGPEAIRPLMQTDAQPAEEAVPASDPTVQPISAQ